MVRARWIAGSVLKVDDLNGEYGDLALRQTKHQDDVHPTLDNALAAVGAHVRAVDGSVGLSMTAIEKQPGSKTDDTMYLRGWVVSVGTAILSLNWAAGGKIAAHLRGALSCRTLNCNAMKFSQAIAEPAAAQPFRLFRRAANRKEKKPEALVVELAAPADAEAAKTNPPPGLRIGGMTAQGFVPLLEVCPGRGVIIRGNYKPKREVVRKPPADGPSDAALVAAFLRTDAGKAARKDIEEKAKKVDLELWLTPNTDVRGKLVELGWKITNNTSITLKSLRVMAAVMPVDPTIAPAWTEQPPSLAEGVPITTLDPGKSAPGRGGILIGQEGNTVDLLVVGEADYSVPVTYTTSARFAL